MDLVRSAQVYCITDASGCPASAIRAGASRRGKGKEARDLLATVCDRFAEGFDTSDLKEVKALLDKLESQTTLRPCGCMASQMLATFAFGLCV